MSQPILQKQTGMRDSDTMREHISTVKMQLDNSMEHNKNLLCVIENLAHCAMLIAQDNLYLSEQALSLEQEAARLDQKIQEFLRHKEEAGGKSKESVVGVK